MLLFHLSETVFNDASIACALLYCDTDNFTLGDSNLFCVLVFNYLNQEHSRRWYYVTCKIKQAIKILPGSALSFCALGRGEGGDLLWDKWTVSLNFLIGGLRNSIGNTRNQKIKFYNRYSELNIIRALFSTRLTSSVILHHPDYKLQECREF